VPYSNQIQKITGHWDMVFIVAAAANIAAAVLAIAVLKPWRARVIRNSAEGAQSSPEMAPARA
jgi:OFA family oxalate/formate antiporter-like MFS transporter